MGNGYRVIVRDPDGEAPQPLAREPLVSVILMCRGVAAMTRMALDCHRAQTYARRELVLVGDIGELVYEGLTALGASAHVPFQQPVPYDRIPEMYDVGVMASRGDLLSWWADDDWRHSECLARQVGALVATGAQVCAINPVSYVDLRNGRRALYDNASMPIDGPMMLRRDAYRRGATLHQGGWQRAVLLGDKGLFVCSVHGRNAWAQLDRENFTTDPNPVPVPDGLRQLARDLGFASVVAA